MRKANVVEKVSGTVEMVVPAELDVVNGFTSDDCIIAIKNDSMRARVKEYRNATLKEMRGQWERAIATAKMSPEIRAEFGSDSRLAQFLGMKTRGEFSKLQAAGKLALEAKKEGFEISQLPPITTVFELLPVANDKHGNQNLLDCAMYVANNEMTQAETRDYVKSFVTSETKPETDNQTEQDNVNDSLDSIPEMADGSNLTVEDDAPHWCEILCVDESALANMENAYRNEFYNAIKQAALNYFDENEIYLKR